MLTKVSLINRKDHILQRISTFLTKVYTLKYMSMHKIGGHLHGVPLKILESDSKRAVSVKICTFQDRFWAQQILKSLGYKPLLR